MDEINNKGLKQIYRRSIHVITYFPLRDNNCEIQLHAFVDTPFCILRILKRATLL